MASTNQLFQQKVRWRLVSQDDDTVIEGQWHPSNVQHTFAANYSQVQSLGRPQPILQYDGDILEKITFEAHIRAMHQGFRAPVVNRELVAPERIEELVERIKGTVRRSSDLGRPHTYVFELGESLEMPCVVKSVGPIVYDRFRPDGSLRGVTFSLELWRYDPYDADLGGTPNESLVLPLRPHESFESLALRVYGDPEAGEALRRRNPEHLVPKAGALVHLPPKALLMRGFVLEPQALVLRRDSEEARRVRQHFLSKPRTRVSHKLGPAWERA